MDRVYLRDGITGAAKQFRHVLVPSTFAQQRAMRMHLGDQHFPPILYGRDEQQVAGDAFAVGNPD